MTPEQRKHFEWVRDNMHGEPCPQCETLRYEIDGLQAKLNEAREQAQKQEPVADVNVRPSPHGGCGIASVLSHKLPVGSWLLYASLPQQLGITEKDFKNDRYA